MPNNYVDRIILYYYSDNNKLPDYTDYCLKQIINLYSRYTKKYHVFFLTNIKYENTENITYVDISEYSAPDIKVFDDKNPLWKYSIIRYFHIRDFIKNHNKKRYYHIELDCLVYKPFFLIKKYFNLKDYLSFPKDTFTRGIASFMFIPNYSEINNFCDHIINLQSQNIIANDMYYLGSYYTPDYLLLTNSNEYYVDAAAFGQIIDGTHQNPGVPFENETALFKPKRSYIYWDPENLCYYYNKAPIVLIHFHSKQLHKYTI